MNLSVEQIKLMVEISTLYYKGGLTQGQVAAELRITRQRVNQLLKAAQTCGIVEIKVTNPLQSSEHLRRSLISAFGLKDVEVSLLSDDSSPSFAAELGRAGAVAVARRLREKSVVGIGWGTAVYEFVHAMKENGGKTESLVVPLIGGLGDTAPHFQINWLAAQLAGRIGGRVRPLHAPYLVERPDIKDTLLSDRVLSETTGYWSKLDIAVMGIGISISRSPLLYSPHFTSNHVLELEQRGIVGDICSRFFDIKGRFHDWDINERLIAISLEQIRECPLVVAIAGGANKFTAIQAALKGKYIDVLVTDSYTAERLLAQQSD